MQIKEALKEYGLTENEIEIYLVLLPLGSINLQQISKRIGLPRTTIYNTLNYLAQKGLISTIIKKNAKHYEATDPEKIIDKIEEKKQLILQSLPELKALKETIKKSSSVEIYEGQKGLFTLLSDVFKKKQETYYFGSYSLSVEMLKHFPGHFRTIRMERRIPAKIVMDSYDDETFHTKLFKQLTELRFNNALKNFPCMIFIYGNKVAMYTLKKDLIGIIIDNEQVAEAMKFIFDTYWKTARKAKL
jgi:HTH-type transcriptional regulator, sugar sensing transcriptional regulator